MKNYLSDVLKVKDLKNYGNKICIYAGVGSGKNFFIEHYLSGEDFEKGETEISEECGNILYVTSRRAKVDEIVAENVFKENIDDNYYNRLTVITYYGAEQILKYNKFSKERLKEFICSYKYLVIDEAHSIFTDSTFADSCFYVKALINYAIECGLIVILMTGTPAPIMKYVKTNKWEVIDCLQKCNNVLPRNVAIITRQQAFKIIEKDIKLHKKNIYMSNSAKDIIVGDNSIYNKLVSKYKFNKDEIAICMSDSKESELITDKKIKEINKQAYESLTKDKKLPEQINVLICTSRLKEGINILDEKVQAVFCESTLLTDVQQFMGRVRHGVNMLYIIRDAKQNYVSHNKIEADYCKKSEISNANSYINNIIMKKKTEEIDDYYFNKLVCPDLPLWLVVKDVNDFIKFIEDKYRYIRYNTITERFELYGARIQEEKRLVSEHKKEQVKLIENYFTGKDIVTITTNDNKGLSPENRKTIVSILEDNIDKEIAGDNKAIFMNSILDLLVEERVNARITKEKINDTNKILNNYHIKYFVESVKSRKKENRDKYVLVVKSK